MKNEAVSYDDVLLKPQYSDIRSRAEIDISTDLGTGLKLEVPIFSSPMDTVSEKSMAITLGKEGACSIIHRYNNISEQGRHLRMARDIGGDINVGAAIGVTGDYIERAQSAYECGATFICVDVAHEGCFA